MYRYVDIWKRSCVAVRVGEVEEGTQANNKIQQEKVTNPNGMISFRLTAYKGNSILMSRTLSTKKSCGQSFFTL
jgi:hypothetical protein